MSILTDFKDKQNRFVENYEERTLENTGAAIFIALISILITSIYFYNDFKTYGFEHPISYIQLIFIFLLVVAFIMYKFFPAFAYKNFVFTLFAFSYFTSRSFLFGQAVAPGTIYIMLVPVIAAYSISLRLQTYFFVGSLFVMTANLFNGSISSYRPLVVSFNPEDFRLFANNIVVSIALYVFVRVLIRKEEHSYELLENRLEKNSHLARLSSLGEMSAAIAHEINNPLQIIFGSAKLMERKVKTQEFIPASEIIPNLNRVVKALRRMESVVRTMLNLTRKENIIKEETSLQVIYDVLKPIVKEKVLTENIKFDFNKDFFNLPIYCNPEALAQVFINLVSNAVDAVAATESPWINVITRADENNISILFVDSGTGIEKNVLNRIFEPFYTTKGVNKGTGMGLSISQRIMIDQGGKLQYHLKDGNTCFEVSIPRYKRPTSLK